MPAHFIWDLQQYQSYHHCKLSPLKRHKDLYALQPHKPTTNHPIFPNLPVYTPRHLPSTTSLYSVNPKLSVDVTPPGITRYGNTSFLSIPAYDLFRNHKPAPVHPFHPCTERGFSPVPVAGLFPAGHRSTARHFVPLLFCIAPVRYRV
jgi:hypothetical protein